MNYADAMRQLADRLGVLVDGHLTSASVGISGTPNPGDWSLKQSVVDATRTEENDIFTGGTFFVISGAVMVARRIFAFDTTTKTFQIAPVGDLSNYTQYYACGKQFPEAVLRDALYASLLAQGPYWKTEIPAGLVTVADQESYALPVNCKGLLRVEVATNAVAPFAFTRNFRWVQVGNTLEFMETPTTDDVPIRLTYLYSWPDGEKLDTAILPDSIFAERILVSAAVHALRWRVRLAGNDEPAATQMLNEALNKEAQLLQTHPKRTPLRDPIIAKVR
jgi:hypothetical protein